MKLNFVLSNQELTEKQNNISTPQDLHTHAWKINHQDYLQIWAILKGSNKKTMKLKD
jgi:hypothetical protein